MEIDDLKFGFSEDKTLFDTSICIFLPVNLNAGMEDAKTQNVAVFIEPVLKRGINK
jgi:hypothetical protein